MASSHRARVGAAIVLALVIALPGGAPATAASRQAFPPAPAAASIDWMSGFYIHPGRMTASPDVTLQLLQPPTNDPLVMLSNDGIEWVTMPFATSIAWSLVDADAGGVDTDGLKRVSVQFGDGTTWTRYAWAEVTLDRTAPVAGDVAGVTIGSRLWQGTVDGTDGEALPEIAATRVSLDAGASWSAWADGNALDIWNMPGAAAWVDGAGPITVQLRDTAGNESDAIETTPTIEAPAFPQWDSPDNTVKIAFETPERPISGRPFTIRVVYPDGYVLPQDAWCQWDLHWGDDASITGLANPTFGELLFDRGKSSGACTEWTFTLPYRAIRQFAWTFQMGHKGPNVLPPDFSGGLFISNTHQVFRALADGTDPRFLTSNIPFVYVLPEQTIAKRGDPVTYRLHAAGTTTLPTGSWSATPLDCFINPSLSQEGGSTYTYTPTCDGSWVTVWNGVMGNGWMRSEYDPLVDGRDPRVSAPAVKLRVAGYGSSAPATVKWSGKDSGSGVYRYILEVSRDGGAWRRIDLPSRLTTSITKSLAMTSSYRFRVKARDRVGNWSDWSYGPTVRATPKEESSTYTRWSGSWTTVADAALSGGKAKATTSAAAAARITISARSIAWVSRRGPGRGLAQVWVDGALAATVDLGAATLTGRTVVFARSWSSGGTHTLRIVPLGTAGRPLVEVDAFLVVR